jgi:hypothetical protein
MRWVGLALGALLLVCPRAAPRAARADEPAATGGTGRAYSHKSQVGVYAQGGIGYRMLVAYDQSAYCGDPGKSLCTGSTPPWLELGLSYGVSSSVELIADLRLGLADDFVPPLATGKAPRPLVIAPGVKLYINDQGSLKWFTTFQAAIDFTDYSTDGATASTDLGLRNVNGLLIDLHRTFGIYFHFGETIGFLRWLRFEMDAGAGLQARFP